MLFVCMKFIIGRKIGLNRIFDHEGNESAVTLVSILPTKVKKTILKEKNGYNAILVEEILAEKEKSKKIYKTEFLSSDPNQFKIGQELSIEQFELDDNIRVEGKGKGKGFSGAIKRHGFSRGPKTHGSDHHRAVGSIGGGYPQRVVLGRKMPGRLGGKHVTIKNLSIKAIDIENNILAVSGAIPGAKKSIVKIITE